MASNKIRDWFDKLKNRRNMRKQETTKKKTKSLENSGESLRDRLNINTAPSYPEGSGWRKTGKSDFFHGDEYVSYNGNKERRRWGPPQIDLNSNRDVCAISECYKIKIDEGGRGL